MPALPNSVFNMTCELRGFISDLNDFAKQHSHDLLRPVGAGFNPSPSVRVLATNTYPDGEEHREDKSNIIHAECAALDQRDKLGIDSIQIVTTKAPCLRCAIELAARGVRSVAMPSPDPISSWYGEQQKALLFMLDKGLSVLLLTELDKHGDLIRDYDDWARTGKVVGRINREDVTRVGYPNRIGMAPPK